MKNKPKSAVALTYLPENGAPIIAAAAKGEVAELIIQTAKDAGIPIVEDELMSEVLCVQEIGACIPEETWEAVAKIFAAVVEVEKKR
jgi:Uncharacterized homolog of the cytoplasmic domain of flagellar protein FhlB